MENDLAPATRLVALGRPIGAGAPLNPPIELASNFRYGGSSDPGVRSYARDHGTATWRAFEEVLGGLEGGRAVSFASGMAAVAAVFELLPVGARVALPGDCYQGVVQLATERAARGLLAIERVAADDTAGWLRALEGADLVWLESPTNPLLVVADLAAISAAPRGARTLLAVDNTFATPLGQRPLERGADLVVHSATKFIGGHSDLLSGVVVARDDALAARIERARELAGATPGALESFLALRGLRTLAVRLARASATALALAERLAEHGAVERVRYPGLPDDPSHVRASQQLDGFGALVSFDVRGGAAAADAVCARVRLVQHATSLGGAETSLERRAALAGQEHLPPGLVRLSVGLEDVEDLWRDLAQALG